MAFSGRLLTDGIKALLEGAGLIVYVGDKPDGSPGGWAGAEGASAFTPYVMLDPVTGGYFDGTICAPFSDARPDYITRSIGATAGQVQWADDKVFETLTAAKPVVVGRLVQLLVPDVHGGVVKDTDVDPPLFYAPSRWRVFETPA